MSKTLLVAINAKYVHTNLAVRYISRYCEDRDVECSFREFSVNEQKSNVLTALYQADCDVYGFSCYIWNISYIIELCKSLKKLKPQRKIFLGGPEVSFDAEELLKRYEFIDYIVCGEGEKAVFDLAKEFPLERCVLYGEKLENIDELPFPYTQDDLKKAVDGEKLIYYETSRGCPFKCSYCLSSVERGVRVLPIERVKREIAVLVENKAQTIKFVDRTFNADKKRAAEIWKYCMELKGDTFFHFEIGADLLDDSLIDLLKDERSKKFQFEIGVQTTNEKTIAEISRVMDIKTLSKNVKRLQQETEIMLHLDLIAGLPHEDFESFRKSFNDIYILNPDVLQLGFLKLLKGTNIRKNAAKYDINFCDFAPYEVFSTESLSFDDIIRLKAIEDVLERYFNSGRFYKTLDIAIQSFTSPFDFYDRFSEYWTNCGLVGQGVKRISLYSHLLEFLKEGLDEDELKKVTGAMKEDFSKWHSNGVGTPDWYKKY